uniref:restriction endonuclease, SacI family n=1 Tax=Alloprevotella sp. TaxID=1872471 RepID=UPI004026993C
MKKVSETVAKKILLALSKNPTFCNDEVGEEIKSVLNGTHKTYKYVLVNGLLAKAVNKEIDALSLQAGDESDGAYDARSLCHKVLVPFEREFMPNSLGGSNEPFLNKPARFPRLTTDNAVRKGNDMRTLQSLISILSKVKNSSLAKKYLSSALANMAEIANAVAEKYELPDSDLEDFTGPQIILDYVCDLTKSKLEGEMCPLVVATIEHFYYGGTRLVVAHKVNESGASSKEVGDIDIFDKEGYIVSSIEVKDKDFAKIDVEHAIKKFAYAKLTNTLFIYGRAVVYDAEEVNETTSSYGRNGYFCSVVSIIDFVKIRLYSIERPISLQEFVTVLLAYAKRINAKDETIEWIKNTALEFAL